MHRDSPYSRNLINQEAGDYTKNISHSPIRSMKIPNKYYG